jgi:hypothetical protein
VLFKGGDALSVSLNTVAILFLTEIDNAAYSVGMSERVHTRIEQFGRVKMTDSEAVALALSKEVHVVSVVAGVLVAVWVADLGMSMFCAFIVFWLGGVAEALTLPGGGGAEMAMGAAKTTGASVLGFAGFFVLNRIALS